MAITPFHVSYETVIPELTDLLLQSALPGKEKNEVLFSFEAIYVWKDWFLAEHGQLKEIRHRSNGDDPPDLDLIFEAAQIGLEHTALKPYPLGYAQAIAAETNPGGGRFLPSVSRGWIREQLKNLAVGLNPSWGDVDAEHRTILDALIDAVRRKTNDASQIICIRDEATTTIAAAERLMSDFASAVTSTEFAVLGTRFVIFLRCEGEGRFFSGLLTPGERLQIRTA